MSQYVATLNAVAVSAAQDVFELVAPATSQVLIREIVIGQYSDAGDAEAELLSILLIRGYTTTGSGGAAVTPVNLDPYSTLTAGSTVKRNNTTVASAGSPKTVWADTLNIQIPWTLPRHVFGKGILIQPSQRFVARITGPADAITMNASMAFDEIGKMPVS